MEGATPDLADIELEIRIVSPDAESRVRQLQQVWLERCPIYLALEKPQPVSVRFVTHTEATPA